MSTWWLTQFFACLLRDTFHFIFKLSNENFIFSEKNCTTEFAEDSHTQMVNFAISISADINHWKNWIYNVILLQFVFYYLYTPVFLQQYKNAMSRVFAIYFLHIRLRGHVIWEPFCLISIAKKPKVKPQIFSHNPNQNCALLCDQTKCLDASWRERLSLRVWLQGSHQICLRFTI